MASIALYVGVAVAGLAFSRMMSVKQDFTSESGRLDDLNLKGSRYGESLPFALGKNRLSLNTVWCTPLVEHITTTSQKSGGKGGGGSKVKTTTYSYTADFGGVLSNNPQAYPLRIFFDKELVWEYDVGAPALSGNLIGGGSFEFLSGEDIYQPPPAIVEAFLGGGNSPAYRGRASIWFNDINVVTGTRPNVEVECVSSPGIASIGFGDVIELVALEAGIPAESMDASEVSGEVVGVVLDGGSAGGILEGLMVALGIQAVTSGNVLKFSMVDQLVQDFIIPEEDILDVGGKSRFPIEMARDEDMPNAIYIRYFDVDRDHQVATQRAFRKTGRSTQQVTLTLKASMTATAAAATAESILYRAWIAQRRYGPFRLSCKYLRLETGDIVKISYRGKLHVIRLTEVSYGADLSLQVSGEAYDPTVTTSTEGGDSGSFPNKGLPTFGDTYTYAKNLPALLSDHVDRAGFYFAAAGTGAAWKGGVLAVSRDGSGGGWVTIAEVPAPSTMGYAITTLPNPPVNIGNLQWDLSSSVDIQLYSGEAYSVTSDEVFAGANGFMIGEELIQARSIVALGGRRFRLSFLLRGRQGTDAKMTGHGFEEPVVVAQGLTFVDLPTSDRGNNVSLQFTPYGGGSPKLFNLLYTARTIQPRAPEYLRAVWLPSGDIEITSMLTTRRTGELPNIGEVASEYTVRLVRYNFYTASWDVRFRNHDVEGVCLYTLAEQTYDTGGAVTELHIGAQQYSPPFHEYGIERLATLRK